MTRLLASALLLFTASSAAAHPGVGIVRDSRGNVCYTDLKHVWKVAPDGTKAIAVPNVHTHELYLDAEDKLYGEHLWYEGEATDRWGHRVWRLHPDGALESVIPPREGFLANYSFVRDSGGTMYWADRAASVIRKRTADGRVEVHVRAAFRDVRWMTATRVGAVYLIDDGDLLWVDREGRVETLARDLREQSRWWPHVGARHNLMGLWTDREGNVYVAVHGAGKVKKVDRTGRVTVAARTRWPWSPTGGLVAPNSDLWLLEYSVTNAARVRRIGRDGTVETY